MTTDALATPWSVAPLLDVDVLALPDADVLAPRAAGPRPALGPWGDRPLPVPVPAWRLREPPEVRPPSGLS